MLSPEQARPVSRVIFDALAYAKRLEPVHDLITRTKGYRHSAKFPFAKGEGEFMRNPIWFCSREKPNRIPDKFAASRRIFRNDALLFRFHSKIMNRLLESAGFTRQQAEMFAEEQGKLIDGLATKFDIDVVKADSEQLRLSAKADSEIMRRDIIVRLGGMIVALGGLLLAIKYFG